MLKSELIEALQNIDGDFEVMLSNEGGPYVLEGQVWKGVYIEESDEIYESFLEAEEYISDLKEANTKKIIFIGE